MPPLTTISAVLPEAHQTPNWHLAAIVAELKQLRTQWRHSQHRPQFLGKRNLPALEIVQAIIKVLANALFPMRLGSADLHQEAEDYYVGLQLDIALNKLLSQVRLELIYQAYLNQPHAVMDYPFIEQEAIKRIQAFAAQLPTIRRLLDQDVLAAFKGDPAARSVDEVLMCYPGIKAVLYHRIAHQWYRQELPLLARMLSEIAHSETGVDIHPGATIGEGFFIDHGTGVVIGETAVIGKHVRLYQAVTLGAKSFPRDLHGNLQKGLQRHPTIEDEVVIYAGATVLGNITIGHHSVIGGNVWLTQSVPPHSHVLQDNLPVRTTQPHTV